jgi:hypothetical protein
MVFLQPYVKLELKDSYLTAWRSGNAAYLNLDVNNGNFNRDAAYSHWRFLVAFAKLRKATTVHLTVLHKKQLNSHCTDFHGT